MPDSETGFVCRKCKEPVQEGARKCPHCGHNAAAMGGVRLYASGWWNLPKWLCYITIVFIPLGLWIRRKQKRHKAAYKRGVAVPAGD